ACISPVSGCIHQFSAFFRVRQLDSEFIGYPSCISRRFLLFFGFGGPFGQFHYGVGDHGHGAPLRGLRVVGEAVA
ncbi:MAG: hypothetical protein OXC95_16500, partial [Dehalococcoidia bacterium]|nr:hypothetical protein [Dehalococcoidia bacterium]